MSENRQGSDRAPLELHKNGEVPLVPPQVISIIGPELSGKSEQGKILAKRTNLPLIKMGDIFRAVQQEDSDLGRRAVALQQTGKYADTDLFREVFLWGTSGKDQYKNGFVIEGAPRTLEQFKIFGELVLQATGQEMPLKVAYLNVTRGHAHVRQEKRAPRIDDAQLDTRLDTHFEDLSEKIKSAKDFADKFVVVPTVVRGKGGEIVGDRLFEDISNDVIDKLGLDRTQIRTYRESQLTDAIREIDSIEEGLIMEDIGHDINTLPRRERQSAILAYMKNIGETLAQTQGEDTLQFLLELKTYLERLYAENI